jgi:uncharacterized protein (TIGR02996 family)
MSHKAFLDAILSEPDEIAHRLVYADWLEDQGDEPAQHRAEFIRAQIERASLHPAHPRTRALLHRERELLARYSSAWAGRVAALAQRFSFHRGFVEEASINCEYFLPHSEELFAIAPIRRAHLRRTTALARLHDLPGVVREVYADCLCRIKALDVRYEHVTSASAEALLGLTVQRLPRLEELYLGRDAFVMGPLLERCLPMLASLRTLEVAAVGGIEGIQTLLHAPQLAGLERLSLAGSHLGDRSIRLLANSPRGGLRSLSLGHGNLTAEGVRELIDSPLAESLESLDLSFNHLGVEGAGVLANARSLSRLTQLNLSRTFLGDEGARVLAEGSLLGQLWGLDLSMNAIGEKGALALAQRKASKRLMTLDLIYNPLGPALHRLLMERYGEEVCLFNR